MATYKDEDQEIKKDVDGAATDEEIIYFETVTFCTWLDAIPCIVERTTRGLSANPWQ